MTNFLRFLRSEDGAAVVDWMILTAAATSLCLTTFSVVSGGATSVASSTASTIESVGEPSEEGEEDAGDDSADAEEEASSKPGKRVGQSGIEHGAARVGAGNSNRSRSARF